MNVKQDCDKHNRKGYYALTESEYAMLQNRAAEMGISIAAYLRYALKKLWRDENVSTGNETVTAD